MFNFEECYIRSTELDENGTISAVTGDDPSNSDDIDCSNTEVWQPAGWASRPSAATDDGAPTGMVCKTGVRDICVGMRDVRCQAIYGSLKEGENVAYATGPEGKGTARYLMKDDGTTASHTWLVQRGNEASGKDVTVQLTSDGVFSIAIEEMDSALFTMDDDAIRFNIGQATFEMKANGEINFIGTKININCSSLLLGPNAVVPMTVGPIGATAMGSTCIFASP